MVRDENGDFIGTPDRLRAGAIAIEYQGSDHWTNPAVFAEDIERRISSNGPLVDRPRHRGPHLPKLHWTLERIRNALRDHRAGPPAVFNTATLPPRHRSFCKYRCRDRGSLSLTSLPRIDGGRRWL
jgi:hypothetical protein